jgi:hypothetical protein
MLNLIGAIVGMMAIGINLVAFTSALSPSLSQRIMLAAIAGAWVGLAVGLGEAGQLVFSPDQPVPLIGVLFAAPLLIVGALSLASPSIRSALTSVPMPMLIGLNALRVFGGMFLFLAAVGRLSGPFPFSAGWGDVITGGSQSRSPWQLPDRSGRHSARSCCGTFLGRLTFSLLLLSASHPLQEAPCS